MKKHLFLFLAALAAGTLPLCAQFGGGPSVPQMDNSLQKLFGNNLAFSADTHIQVTANNGPMTLSGKMYFDHGKSRTEMDLSQLQGGNIPPQALAQMKSIGLDKMVSITQPGNHVVDMVYPNAQAYAEMTVPSSPTDTATNGSPVTLTSMGNETIGGHPCVKNKAVVTDAQGGTHNFTVWNATDLNNFPMQITAAEGSAPFTLTFMNVSLSKPDSSLFTPPSGFTKYDDMQQMMQSIMMKSFGAGMMPGGRPPQ